MLFSGCSIIPAGSGEPDDQTLNAYAVIFSLVTVLALATASECHSITYLPSLLYGVVLWEWWGLIAGALWKWGKQTCFLSRPSVSAILIQLLAGTALGIAHLLLLDSLGNSLLNINRLGMEVLIYGFVFGIIGVIQFQLRPARRHGIPVSAKATLDCAPACPANATGTALSLQHVERDYYAGRVRQAERSSRDAATSQRHFEKYADQGYSAKSSLIAGVGVCRELPGD
jgi:hypothetical protein